MVDAAGERVADVRIVDGLIAEVGESLTSDAADARVLDAGGCVVTPGLVDLHVHLREPGDEEAETIETGCRAAARGGFTGVVAMPNTRPPLDDAAVVELGARDRERSRAVRGRIVGVHHQGSPR